MQVSLFKILYYHLPKLYPVHMSVLHLRDVRFSKPCILGYSDRLNAMGKTGLKFFFLGPGRGDLGISEVNKFRLHPPHREFQGQIENKYLNP
jgi:hypothetical protein